MHRKLIIFLSLIVVAIAATATSASACGGFFCQNNPVDQVGERIVFTDNGDGTITTLIEIQYVGSAEDFSWVLPIPEAIGVDDLQVPDDGDLVFDELHAMTDMQFIPPEPPDCANRDMEMMATADAADSGGVDVFASGEVGPFGFDVIGSEDPDALIGWLRDNSYRVTPDMEPLLNVYVEDEMAFVAMRLLDGETAESIQPIEITYPGTQPMIPLRLTAVAALPNMPIWVWVFGEHQAVSTNFTNMEIATEEISFFPFGGNDYTFLVQQRANALDGHAFITEYAQRVGPGAVEHPWLDAQIEKADYLTRLNTYIDPQEMTVDPVFGFDADKPDVSNVRDASDLDGLYSCQRDGSDDGIFGGLFSSSDAVDPMNDEGQVVAYTPGEDQPAAPNPIGDSSDDGNDTEGGVEAEIATGDDLDPSGDDGNGVIFAIVAILAGLGAVVSLGIRRSDD